MTVKNQWLKKPQIKTQQLINLYQKGLSSQQIAEQFSVAKSTISRRLKKAGVPLRSSSDYDKEKRYWLWKGEDYIDPVTRKRNQLKHRKWSKAVLDRDNHSCQLCGKINGRLEAHHKIPLKECINSYLEFDVDNGITLCVPCHRNIHKTHKV